jgi:hypothetical protein
VSDSNGRKDRYTGVLQMIMGRVCRIVVQR